MVKDKSNSIKDKVKVKVRFLGILQKYSDGKREVEQYVSPEPGSAVEYIIEHYSLPWDNDLEKMARIFINNNHLSAIKEKGDLLKDGDVIAFIQMSGGG